jgi:hypothetical protein
MRNGGEGQFVRRRRVKERGNEGRVREWENVRRERVRVRENERTSEGGD